MKMELDDVDALGHDEELAMLGEVLDALDKVELDDIDALGYDAELAMLGETLDALEHALAA